MFNYGPHSFLVDFHLISVLSCGHCGSFLIIVARAVKKSSFCSIFYSPIFLEKLFFCKKKKFFALYTVDKEIFAWFRCLANHRFFVSVILSWIFIKKKGLNKRTDHEKLDSSIFFLNWAYKKCFQFIPYFAIAPCI